MFYKIVFFIILFIIAKLIGVVVVEFLTHMSKVIERKIKNKVEIVIVINAFDIENSKARADIGVKYENEVLRLIDAFRDVNLLVGSVCITRYHSTPAVDKYILKLNNLIVKNHSIT